MSVSAKEMMIGNYFKDKKSGVIVEIDARTIFDTWKESHAYDPAPITYKLIDRLNGKPLDGGVSYRFDEVCIMQTKSRWAIGFVDIVGIVRWTNTEIDYIHQLQHICLEINQEPLQFVK